MHNKEYGKAYNKALDSYKTKLTVKKKKPLTVFVATACSLAALGGLTAGHFAYKASHAIANNHEIVLDPTVETKVEITEIVTTVEGNKECEVRSYEKEMIGVKVTIGNNLLKEGTDYIKEVINDTHIISGYKVTIYKESINKYEGSIKLTPQFNEGSEELEKKITELQLDIEAKKTEIEKQKKVIQEDEEKIAKQETEIESLNQQIKDIKAAHEKELAELEAKHKTEIDNLKAAHEKELADQKASYEAQIASLETAHQKAIKDLTAKYEAELKAAEEKSEAEKAAIKADYEAQITKLKEDHAAELAAQKEAYETQIATLKATHEKELADQKASYDKQLADQKADYEAQLADKDTQIKTLTDANTELQEKLDTANETITSLNTQIDDLKADLKTAQDALVAEQGKVVVTFINKDGTFNSSEKVVSGAAYGKDLPTVTSNYQWQDASGNEFTKDTEVSGSCIVKENCLYSITLDNTYVKASTGSSSVKITATFSDTIDPNNITWSGVDETIKSLAISEDKTECTLTVSETGDNSYHTITCTDTSGVSASCNVFVYNKQVSLQADTSLSTFLSDNNVYFNSITAKSLTYQNRVIIMRYRRSESSKMQLSVYLKSGTYSTSLTFTFLYTGSSTSDYGYTTATMPTDFWAKLEDGATVTLSGTAS